MVAVGIVVSVGMEVAVGARRPTGRQADNVIARRRETTTRQSPVRGEDPIEDANPFKRRLLRRCAARNDMIEI